MMGKVLDGVGLVAFLCLLGYVTSMTIVRQDLCSVNTSVLVLDFIYSAPTHIAVA